MIIGVILAILQIVGDITKADTLSPEYFKGVKKVINLVSVIVGPKEGDTPDRDKYKQVCCMPNLCQICTSICHSSIYVVLTKMTLLLGSFS